MRPSSSFKTVSNAALKGTFVCYPSRLRHSLLLKQKKETCPIIVFYYWRAECESEGHDHIRQKKEVNLFIESV